MLNNNIELIWSVESAFQFMMESGITILGLKKIFLNNDGFKDYQTYLSEQEVIDDEDSLFGFLNENWGLSDEEVIEQILEAENKEYFIEYINDRELNNTYWNIYEVKNKYKKGFNLLMDYYDSISDEEKPIVDKKLKELGL